MRCCAGPRRRASAAAKRVRAVAAVSAPLDLAAGGRAIGRGFGRQVYTRMFLRTMKPKALAKLAPASRACSTRDATARGARPVRLRRRLHRAAARLSRRRRLLRARLGQAAAARIRIPALVLNARNDPFLPAAALPRPGEVGADVTLWQPRARRPRRLRRRRAGPGHLRRLPEAVAGWLARASLSVAARAESRAWTTSSPRR